MDQPDSRLMIVDHDPYTSGVLVDELTQRGFENIRTVSDFLELPAILQKHAPDVLVFNYHYDHPESLLACSNARMLAPNAAIIAIASPGPTIKKIRAWAKQSNYIDLIIEKPLSDERFYSAVREMLNIKATARQMEERVQKLTSLVPEAAMEGVNGGHDDAEMFEAAVLFTDIRNSSQHILSMPPREFFNLLNENLSSQAAVINRYEGSVIKYTGDGVMAIFRGMGRSYLALRCGLELARISADEKIRFGVGIAEGLVLSGFIGDFTRAGERRQYDVIGATVHLASRICNMASAGEVITTRNISALARLDVPQSRSIGNVAIRGFDREVECIAYRPDNNKETV
ncbi:MAG TPA: adenylate/guanylate cyclase domain-containing protein [Methylophilaceae bacterium]|nr:adenylate/guanylate cyclase domain-containing protein [Methylophilaceae bacterium]